MRCAPIALTVQGGRSGIDDRGQVDLVHLAVDVVGFEKYWARRVGRQEIRGDQLSALDDDAIHGGQGEKVFRVAGVRIFEIPRAVRVRDEINLWLLQHQRPDNHLTMQQGAEIEDGISAGNLNNVAGREERRTFHREPNDVDGWLGEESERQTLDLDFFSGGLFEIGNDLRAIVIDVQENRREEYCRDENAGGDQKSENEFAASGHASSRSSSRR